MADSRNRERSLLRFAEQVEDAAAGESESKDAPEVHDVGLRHHDALRLTTRLRVEGLHSFREHLPRSSATRVVAVVGELFAISSVLRQIHHEAASRHYAAVFWRMDDDLALLFKTLKLTLDEIFGMFARSHEGRAQIIWEGLLHQMDQVEGCNLKERLDLYRDFLDAQFAVLEARGTASSRELREDLRDLLAAQERVQHRRRRSSVSGASTPRPRISSRPTLHRLDTPSTPTVISDEWDNYTNADRRPPIPVPEVPPSPLSPLSPTFTSSSSQTMSSSQTSYSSDPHFSAPPIALVHWAQNVFNGSHTLTQYMVTAQRHDRSECFGPVDLTSLPNLGRDGFQRVLELPFDEERLWVRLYWRPSDHRARVLIMTKDRLGQILHYCTPLTNLKIIRNGSCLQLCRARRGDGQYMLWARLNFLFHERMVLFYSIFVAMKRQDKKPTHPDLLDQFELEIEDGEQELFAGELKHGEMFHALRLFRDRGSGVVRLEACPLRGPKKDVPIWTAFVTKYAYDPDWAHFEGAGIVSFAALRPPASVFIAHYEPPRNRPGNYVLPFTTDEDAAMFIETWTGLCNSYGRHL